METPKKCLEEMESCEFGEVEERFVCQNCFGDIGLKKYIKSRGMIGECSYCEEKNEYVLSFENLLNYIEHSLSIKYQLIDNAGIPYDGSKGGWLIDPIDINEVLESESLGTKNDKLLENICNELEENYYVLKPHTDDELMYDLWLSFTYHIMHKSRFLFDEGSDSYDGEEWRNSRNMPYKIAEILAEKNLFTEIRTDEELYRVRLSNDLETVHTAKTLGTVPRKKAIYPNRMSPVGIPMFYGAKDLKTAILEIFNEEATMYHAGVFNASRKLILVNLTAKIPLPSVFEEEKQALIAVYKFINSFIGDISLPVSKDTVENLFYLPTQIITEFLRYRLKYEGQPIDGIMYKSSKVGAKLSFVLFVENENCVEKDSKLEGDELYLICQSIQSGKIKQHIQKSNDSSNELYQLHFTLEEK